MRNNQPAQIASAVAAAVDFNPVSTIELSPAVNVGAGLKFTIDVPAVYRVHDIELHCTNIATAALITDLEVKINGVVKHKYYDGSDRDVMNQHDNMPAYTAHNILTIPFERKKLKNRQANERTAINLGAPDKHGQVARSMHISGVLDAALVNPSIKVYARVSAPRPGAFGDVISILPYDFNNTFVNQFYDIVDIPRARPDVALCNRVFFKNANITEVELKRDNKTSWIRTAAANDYALACNTEVRKKQAGWFLVDRSESGYGGDFFRMAGFSDVRWRVKQSSAGTLTAYVEHLGSLE